MELSRFSHLYAPLLVARVFDSDLDRIVWAAPPSLSRLHSDDSVARDEIVEAEIIDFRWFEAIEIDVIEGHGPPIFLDEREGGARHVVRRRANPARKAANERGLAGPQLAVQEDDIAGGERLRHAFADCLGFFL